MSDVADSHLFDRGLGTGAAEVAYTVLIPSGYNAAEQAIDQSLDHFGPALRPELHLRLREVLGNPFRPVSVAPTWLTPQVLAVARAVYDERRWDDLPFLADALEEAGCTNEAILSHCRGPGPHVRGCWALDVILGKA